MRKIALAILWSALALAQTFSPANGPIVQNAGPSTATIWWLNFPREGEAVQVAYSLPGGEEKRVAASHAQVAGFSFHRYEVRLDQLQPGQLYSYRLCAGDAGPCTTPNFFRTAPGPDEETPVVVVGLGDNGSALPEQAATMANLLARISLSASALIHFGDMTHSTSPQEFQDFLRVFGGSLDRLSFWPVLGNHDTMDPLGTDFILRLESLPCAGVPQEGCGRYYSFDLGDAHFIALDSTDFWSLQPGSQMLTWLTSDLAATKKRWKIAYFHHPPFLTGFHAEDDLCAEARKNVVPILERYGVQLVFSGHEHGYQRTFPLVGGQIVADPAIGTTYVVSGGGGSPLYDAELDPSFQRIVVKGYNVVLITIKRNSVTVWAIGTNGETLDRFFIFAGPSPRPPQRR